MKKYKLKNYIEELNKYGLIEDINISQEVFQTEIGHVSYNSKEIIENTLFVVKGKNFKEEYLKEAIKNGVICYISDIEHKLECSYIKVNDVQMALAVISKMFFEYESIDLNIIGVGGTKGKTTTTKLIHSILEEYNKNKNAIVSSLVTYDGVEKFDSHITTPESYELYKHIYNANQSDFKNIVIEVSSQALKTNRVAGIQFDFSVFTNICEDHISPIEHPNYEDYFESKMKIFRNTKTAIVNYSFEEVVKEAKKYCNNVVTYSKDNIDADVYAYDIEIKEGLTTFKVHTKKFDKEFQTPLTGDFNIENILAAITVCYLMGIPEDICFSAISNTIIEGRMEKFKSKDNKIIVYVDYAHNKLSFEKLFETIKKEYPDRKIISIFGSVGGKALSRRKDLGSVAGKNSDYIYLVPDDPAYESCVDISKEIAKYIMLDEKNYFIYEDRGVAIIDAIQKAVNSKEEYIIIIAGKGREKTQKYGDKLIPYLSDVYYAEEEIKKYDNKGE